MAKTGRTLRGSQWADALGERLSEAPAATAAWMEQHTRLLKSDTYSRVGLLELRGQPCFLKLYLAKSRWQRLGVRLGYSRALRSFDMAGEFASLGLPVPAPRACVQVAEGTLLLTEGIPESRDLRALWLEQPQPGRAEMLMRRAGETLAALHLAGCAHGDCKWSNLLWSGDRFFLVDLDAARTMNSGSGSGPRPPMQRRQLRDLARFTVDAEETGASREQYNFFLQCYCARIKCSCELLAREIKPEADSIRLRHARKYGKAPPSAG
jgi:tRNA A-37 threonylcarbamoyl transferase component Bud32